jgi:hypothetical protein
MRMGKVSVQIFLSGAKVYLFLRSVSSMVFPKRRLFTLVAISKETELLNAFSIFCFIIIMHYLLYESNCSDWFVNSTISLEICYLWIRSLTEHRGQAPSAALCTREVPGSNPGAA